MKIYGLSWYHSRFAWLAGKIGSPIVVGNVPTKSGYSKWHLHADIQRHYQYAIGASYKSDGCPKLTCKLPRWSHITLPGNASKPRALLMNQGAIANNFVGASGVTHSLTDPAPN
jgi:hypothetical protein